MQKLKGKLENVIFSLGFNSKSHLTPKEEADLKANFREIKANSTNISHI